MKSIVSPAGPDCARFADLLPLSVHHLLTSPQLESMQAHVDGCPHCRATLDIYARLEDAVRRYAGSGSAVPVMSSRAQAAILERPPAGRRRPTFPPRTWRATLATAVATILITGLLAALLLTRGAPGVHIDGVTPHPTAGVSSYLSISVTALDMRASDDVWAAGSVSLTTPASYSRSATPGAIPTPAVESVSFFLHYNGTSWREIPLASNLTITGISMISADAGWAVGYDYSSNTDDCVVLGYQLGRWEVVSHLGPPAQCQYSLRSIAMVDANTGWIVGASLSSSGDSKPLLLQYQRGQWRPVTLPDPDAYELNAITMASSTEGWAVGAVAAADRTNEHRSAYILHYHNGVWQRVGIGQPGLLYDVAETPAGDLWAVGSVTPSQGSVVLHYQAGTWQRVLVPTPNILHAVTFSSATDGWIGGDGEVMLHYNGSSWSNVGIVRHGFEIEHVSAVGTGEAWASGEYLGGSNSETDFTIALLHYSAGLWRVYPLTGIVATP